MVEITMGDYFLNRTKIKKSMPVCFSFASCRNDIGEDIILSKPLMLAPQDGLEVMYVPALEIELENKPYTLLRDAKKFPIGRSKVLVQCFHDELFSPRAKHVLVYEFLVFRLFQVFYNAWHLHLEELCIVIPVEKLLAHHRNPRKGIWINAKPDFLASWLIHCPCEEAISQTAPPRARPSASAGYP